MLDGTIMKMKFERNINENRNSRAPPKCAHKSQKLAEGGTGIQTCLFIPLENSAGKERWGIQSQYWTSISEAIGKDRVTRCKENN
jgi:hypothetical protein